MVIVGESGRRVVVVRPDGDAGLMGVQIAAALARAREERAGLFLLRPPAIADDAVFALRPAADVERIEPRGAARAWLTARWTAGALRDWRRTRAAAATQVVWLETYRELRRHVGDERLPFAIRAWLRDASQRAFARYGGGSAPRSVLPRRLLRDAVRVELPDGMRAAAHDLATRLGVDATRPRILLETGPDPARFAPAVDLLTGAGYQVVRIGEAVEPWAHAGVIDVAARRPRDQALDVYLLLTARWLVCTDPALQQLAYLTATPCLAVNAVDAVASFPVRPGGFYTLATPVDLATGRALTPGDMLSEAYLRNPARYGHRRNSAGEVLTAVREVLAYLGGGWTALPAQTRFAASAVDAATALAPRVPRVAEYGADAGFLGDGHLAAWQAELAA